MADGHTSPEASGGGCEPVTGTTTAATAPTTTTAATAPTTAAAAPTTTTGQQQQRQQLQRVSWCWHVRFCWTEVSCPSLALALAGISAGRWGCAGRRYPCQGSVLALAAPCSALVRQCTSGSYGGCALARPSANSGKEVHR